ncbi:hypothetical protein [Rathayibacter sp. AY1E1]|uniref:hypothetical protein n=1 Tax=Rathayibacter sp. AY1E1 TaxID=2080549 RepID=UPI000CE8AD4C|nr:hypothetical protein [Rathayibacter sp. AY1E1]
MPAIESVNIVALIVAVLGAGGIGVFFRELVSIITLIKTGVSAKESKRKNDLVAQRDREYQRAEAEARNRRRMEEHATVMRRELILRGVEPDDIERWPRLESILPGSGISAPATPSKETP